MTSRTTVTALALIAALGLGGCKAVRDFTAGLVGAPTSDEIQAAATKLAEAEDKVDELEVLAQHADANARRLQEDAQDIELRRAEVRSLYGRLAGQLGTLEGAAADAMVKTLDGLQTQLRTLGDKAAEAAAIAAGYTTEAVKLRTAADAQAIEIDRAAAELAGYRETTEAAIDGVVDFVTFAGDTASSLGVPGAREAASKVREGAMGGLSALLLGGTIWGARTARKRRRERDEEAEGRENLERVVTAVEKFGLLANAPDDARAAAKDWAGTEAHLALKRVLATAGVEAA